MGQIELKTVITLTRLGTPDPFGLLTPLGFPGHGSICWEDITWCRGRLCIAVGSLLIAGHLMAERLDLSLAQINVRNAKPAPGTGLQPGVVEHRRYVHPLRGIKSGRIDFKSVIALTACAQSHVRTCALTLYNVL